MADLPTFNDLFDIGAAEVLARNKQLSTDAVQREGTDANAFVAASAAVGDEVIGQAGDLAKAVYLSSATDSDLDRVVFDRYGLKRKPAAVAMGSVQFTTKAPAAASFTIPTGTQLQTPTGQAFITTTAVTFPQNSTGPVTVAVRSTLAGADQQAAANTINSISGAISGSPADLSVNNTLATAGAADEESDDALRSRAQQFFVTARRGTLAAVEAGALAVAGVTSASAQEVVDAGGQPARFVQLVVTDQFTVALAELGQNPPAYQAQSQLLAQSVFNGLDDYRPAGIYVQVKVAQKILQPIQLALAFAAGADVDTVTAQARAAVVDVVNGLNPGETFDPSLIDDPVIGVLATIVGLVPTGSEVVSPAGPVIPTPLQVICTSLEIVTPISAVPGITFQTSSNPDA